MSWMRKKENGPTLSQQKDTLAKLANPTKDNQHSPIPQTWVNSKQND